MGGRSRIVQTIGLPLPGGAVARPDDRSEVAVEAEVDGAREAFFGARPCEVAALNVLGGVLAGAARPDPVFTRRRDAAFVVTVECGAPAATCSAPRWAPAPRLGGTSTALTELAGPDHRFLVHAWDRSQGRRRTRRESPPRTGDRRRCEGPGRRSIGRAESAISRTLDSAAAPAYSRATSSTHAGTRSPTLPLLRELHPGLPDLLLHRRRGRRPTSTARVERQRAGTRASTVDHSYLHGGAVRATTSSRYRQWMTHKLSTWWDQFGELGLRRLRALHHLVPGRHRHHRGGARRSAASDGAVTPIARARDEA